MLKEYIKKIVYGDKASSEANIKYLRNIGMKIGDESTIYVPTKTQIDTTRPWLIECKDNRGRNDFDTRI